MSKSEIKIEALKHISATHRAALAARISKEWKVLVLSLSYYVAVASTKEFGALPCEVLLISVSFPAVVTSIFLFFLHQSNEISKSYCHTAENSIMEYIKSGIINYIPPEETTWPMLKTRSLFAFFWQSSIVFMMAFVSYHVASS